ncbi:MAG TPA: CRISPR-associated endonuclease Cas1 [Candidatus Binataceae bacterium]|nr:CRISPR-associated endonuclease Cas1 [Candidatus Binataceae bacterium]
MGADLGRIGVRDLTIGPNGWADRCRYWLVSRQEKHRHGPAPRHLHEPLVLTGHGMSLRVDHGALVARGGFTHYPQAAEEHRFFRGDRNLPSRIVVLDGSGSLSFDVLSWLSEQGVPLIRINWRGEVVIAVASGHAIDVECVAAQLEAQRNGRALVCARALIAKKIRNSVATLQAAVPASPVRQFAISKLQREATELVKRPPKSTHDLLGLEGRAAYAYFNAWQSIPVRWKGLNRHPIPPEWNFIGQRYSYARKKGGTRNATHPINAMLNYAYAILESQVRIQIVTAGLDPTIGVLHSGRRGRSDFVLDLMEPWRPVIDGQMLQFVQTHTFHPADFTIRSDGVCRLNPEMAKYIAKMTADQIGRADQITAPAVPKPRKRLQQCAL